MKAAEIAKETAPQTRQNDDLPLGVHRKGCARKAILAHSWRVPVQAGVVWSVARDKAAVLLATETRQKHDLPSRGLRVPLTGEDAPQATGTRPAGVWRRQPRAGTSGSAGGAEGGWGFKLFPSSPPVGGPAARYPPLSLCAV